MQMKKNFFYVAALVLGLSFTMTACSSDDDEVIAPEDIDYTTENADSWHNYMRNVAALLRTDATSLYDAWNTSYNGGAVMPLLLKHIAFPIIPAHGTA